MTPAALAPATSSAAPPADPAPRWHLLTEREREVCGLVSIGRTPEEIAAELGIQVKTTYLHKSNGRAKLGSRNDVEMALLAVREGIVIP